MGNAASSDNVVSLRDFAQSLSGGAAHARPRISSESVGVIADCRDLALKRICEVLRSAFDKIEEELFELAEKTPDHETQNMYLEARAQAREKRTGIESSFRQHFVSRFDGKVRGEGSKPSQAKEALSFADLALVHAHTGDTDGNLVYRKTARNFNPVMATAAHTTVVQVEKLVEPGVIDPDHIHTPGIYVSRLIEVANAEKRIEKRTVRAREQVGAN